MARTLAAMQAGRRRWLAKLNAEGKPIPCGRKKGGRNAPREERLHAGYLRKMDREFRPIDLQMRAERNARRAKRLQERKAVADREARYARFIAGGPYWTEEEWEKL
jgi:hypothetical protein